MVNKIEVGRRIKSIRLSMGYSATEFGAALNPVANRGLVSGWENGRYLPKQNRLLDIAFFGQISVDELLHGKRPDPLIEWIEEQIGGIKLTGFWGNEIEASYNNGYADAMLEVLNHIKSGGKEATENSIKVLGANK